MQGSHDPSGVVFTVLAALSGMEREYIRDRTLEGHESARARGKAMHPRGQNLSLRDIAARLVITHGKKKDQHPSPAPPPSPSTTPAHAARNPQPPVILSRPHRTRQWR
ncbi:hypothetical protein ACIBH1_12145 [Nonomuraea sp. NPDC050663]|uniref:hypothetical protein n=1 Tax=Nonomuraea sp. NPDC050663 TaxID=3364370 RepID=UPI0037AFC8F9